MKKLNKLLALLLALAMVFSLAACSASEDDDDDKKSDKETTAAAEEKEEEEKEEEEEEELSDEEKIVGEWLYQLDLAEVLNEQLGAEMDESLLPNEAFYMNVIFEFKKNDKLTITMELDDDSMEDYIAALGEAMVEALYDMAEQEGMSKADLEKQIKDESGLTIEEYVEEMLEQEMDSAFGDMSQSTTGYYKVDSKKGRVYVGESEDDVESESEYAEYTFSGKKLKLTDFVEDGESAGALGLEEFGAELPLVFEKQ